MAQQLRGQTRPGPEQWHNRDLEGGNPERRHAAGRQHAEGAGDYQAARQRHRRHGGAGDTAGPRHHHRRGSRGGPAAGGEPGRQDSAASVPPGAARGGQRASRGADANAEFVGQPQLVTEPVGHEFAVALAKLLRSRLGHGGRRRGRPVAHPWGAGARRCHAVAQPVGLRQRRPEPVAFRAERPARGGHLRDQPGGARQVQQAGLHQVRLAAPGWLQPQRGGQPELPDRRVLAGQGRASTSQAPRPGCRTPATRSARSGRST